MIDKRQLREDEALVEKYRKLLEDEYMNSFMTLSEFAEKHDICLSALYALIKKLGMKKDMSRFNNSKKPEVIDRIAQTKLERYGDSHYNNPEKNRETTLAHYGVEHAMQSEETKAKAKATFNSHYAEGSEAYDKLIADRTIARNETLKTLDYGDKVRATRARHMEEDSNWLEKSNQMRVATCNDRYGVSNVSEMSSVKDSKKTTRNRGLEEFMSRNDCIPMTEVLDTYGQGWMRELDTYDILYYKRNRYLRRCDLERVKTYKDSSGFKGITHGELDLRDYVKSIYKGTVLENARDVIPPKELDIYLPDRKLALEFNGIFWHSDNGKLSHHDRNYHLDKTLACEKLGIRLIHIFEDQWFNHQDICKSIIASALGVYESRLYARDCECKVLTSGEYRDFLDVNHIQGSVNSSIRLGLYQGDSLVQVAGWGKSRFKKGEVELHRMCTRLNTQVVGGFSKLISHSGLNQFISFVDRSIYSGQGYETTGFKAIGELKPSYFYCSVNNLERINRMSAQKHKLPKLLEKFDSSLSEVDNMFANGYLQVYDCGSLKMEFSI